MPGPEENPIEMEFELETQDPNHQDYLDMLNKRHDYLIDQLRHNVRETYNHPLYKGITGDVQFERLVMCKLSFDELKLGEWYWIRHEISQQVIGCYEFKARSHDGKNFYFYDRATSTGYARDYTIQYRDVFEFFGPFELPQILSDHQGRSREI